MCRSAAQEESRGQVLINLKAAPDASDVGAKKLTADAAGEQLREALDGSCPEEVSRQRAVVAKRRRIWLVFSTMHVQQKSQRPAPSLKSWEHWPALQFGTMTVEEIGKDPKLMDPKLMVEAFLDGLPVHPVRVEMYAEDVTSGDALRVEMTSGQALPGGFIYHASVPAVRPVTDYTARVIPHHFQVSVPLECAQILWQK